MINVEEHIYHDDPKQGHPDVRTFLKDVDYFFLGNGLISAAVQHSPTGEGTQVALLFMDPEKLKTKRETLNFDTNSGLTDSDLSILDSKGNQLPFDEVSVEWSFKFYVPIVEVNRSSEQIEVQEHFYCPDNTSGVLRREIRLTNPTSNPVELEIHTGIPGKTITKKTSLNGNSVQTVCLEYSISSDQKLDVGISDFEPITEIADPKNISFDNELLDRFYNAASAQLQAVVSKSGVVDASIWQYCREWLRDHSFMAVGLILSGQHQKAKVLLERLIRDFVSESGDPMDSSEVREADEAELDQNGTLLFALKTYVLWTGDIELVTKYWEKLITIAEFPFGEAFRHDESGLFCNSRDYWERHSTFGVTPGIELMYQVLPAIGLNCAAALGRLTGHVEKAVLWDQEAGQLKERILHHPKFGLVNDSGFIKRRDQNGKIQESITPLENSGLPDGVPLAADITHYLNPDTSAAMPIAFGFVPADSQVAKATLENMEILWNQGWEEGGYGRYHASSEADSAGSWPFPSLIVARAALEAGDYGKVWRILNWLDKMPGSLSCSWFETYCDRISPPYAQLGITPWTWAEIIMLTVHHMIGIQPEENSIRIRPRLLPGLKKVTGSLPLRDIHIHFEYSVNPDCKTTVFRTNVQQLDSKTDEMLIRYPQEDVYIKALIPEI